MKLPTNKFFEVRPGADTLRYLVTYGLLTMLAKRVSKRPQRLFVEIASNIDRHILSEGLFEKGVIDLLREVVRRAGRTELMVDIGANIGNHTVALAPEFKRIEAVEPHPVLFRILEANVLRNRLTGVTCHNFGLADQDATGTLAEAMDNHGLSRVRERSRLSPETFGLSSEQFGAEYSIELKDTREFLSRFGDSLDRAFIKIDVEGMELEIVTAMLPLLGRYKPLVAFEWFTRQQPEFAGMMAELPGYELWGVQLHDVGRNLLWRAVKLLFTGRSYRLERLDPAHLDDFYPMALLVPVDGR